MDNDPTSASCVVCGVGLPTHGGGEPPAAYQAPAAYEMPAGYGPPAGSGYGSPAGYEAPASYEAPAAYEAGYQAPAGYQPGAPAAFEVPTQSGPGWLPNTPQTPYGIPDAYEVPNSTYGVAQPEAYGAAPNAYGYPSGAYPQPPTPAPESPPYADNAGPGYPGWMASAPPTSGPGTPGVPVSGTPVSGTPMSGAPVSPGYPVAPYDPNAYGPYQPQPSVITNGPDPAAKRSMMLPVIVVAVIVVVAVGAFAAVTLTDHKKTPVAAPTSTSVATTGAPQPSATTDHNVTATTAAPDPAVAHNQAASIDSLLTASVNSRHKLNTAIDKVNRCSDLQGAVSDMTAAGQERQSQIAGAQQTDLSAIPTGGQVRDLLVQALQYSQQADASYTAWAQGALDNGCTDSDQRDRDYSEGQRLSGLAKQAKTSFLAAWNPVASANGVPNRSPDDI